jgi:hypothetical protein
MSRFDAVTTLGWSHIANWELYLWYDVDRLGKKTWRDLQRRFSEDNEGDLYIYETDKQGLLLIHNDGLTTIAKKLGRDGEAED